MKRHPVTHLVIFLVVVCFLFIFGTDASARRGRAGAAAKHRQAAGGTESASSEPCKAYIVMEATTGKVLEERNMHEKRAPASMNKLMVSYVVLDKIAKGELHLTDKVRTSREAMKIGGSQVYLEEGEEFSLEDTMRAIMIASANDSSYAVAELIAGSARDFVDLMNETAKSLGMNDTKFQSVHGLPPEKGQTEDLTSCYDMALLAKAIIKFPKVLEWTSTKTAPFRNGTFILNNHNKLLTRMPEVDGLKTGFYRETGYNVTATAKKGNLRFVVVVMGSPTARARDDFACEKLKHAFGEYTAVTVAKKGQPIDKDSFLADGKFKKIKGVAAADVAIPLMRGRKKDIKQVYDLPRIKGEVKAGQKLGEVVYQLDNEVVGRVDVISPTYIPKANFFTRMVRKTGLNL
jgi:serine-type D-Ala-D-Ala carboxypeptidase (penicillin-binding protein 5/6)